MANRRTTFDELQCEIDLSPATLDVIHKDLQTTELHAYWDDDALRSTDNGGYLSSLLDHRLQDTEDFFATLVTSDEYWFYCRTPEKGETASPATTRTETFRTAPSAGKQMVTIFWGSQGLLVTYWLPTGATINSDRHFEYLTRLRR